MCGFAMAPVASLHARRSANTKGRIAFHCFIINDIADGGETPRLALGHIHNHEHHDLTTAHSRSHSAPFFAHHSGLFFGGFCSGSSSVGVYPCSRAARVGPAREQEP